MRVAVSAFCGLLALAVAASGESGRAATTLPTVRCPIQVGIDGLRFPHWPARQSAAVPASLAGKLAVYVGGLQRVVAPRGWRCNAQEAVDGSDVINVAPRGKDSKLSVSSWSIPACVGCMFDAVCAYFPHEAPEVSVGLPCESSSRGLHTARLSRTLVELRNARGAPLGLVFFEPRGTYQRAAGVSCSAAAAMCEAVLADWRASKR